MVDLKLIGSKITKINAKKNTNFSGKINIKTNIKINSIEMIEKNTLKVSYDFYINYGELGEIEVGGEIFLSGGQKSLKSLLKSQKEKKYDSQEYVSITNLIIQKASIKSFELEEEMGLPIHIKLPTISFKK